MRLDAAVAVLSLGCGLALARPAHADTQPALHPAVARPVSEPATTTPIQAAPSSTQEGPSASTAMEPPPPSAPPAPDRNEANDPWEGVNRKIYGFNNAVDRAFAEPFARAYKRYTPNPVRTGVRNWVANLGAPIILANDIIQLQPKRAGVTIARFGINTTVGVLGVFDAAQAMGLDKHSEDFGQTLGSWGVKPGPYIMLPLLGPSNLRDVTGRVVDVAFDPLTYAAFQGDAALRASRVTLNLVSSRADSLEAVADLRRNSADSYVDLRTAYSQARRSAIRNGHESVDDLPDFAPPLPDDGEQTEAPAP